MPQSRAGGGSSAPLGATISPDGVNFSIFSRYATGVDLLFFDRPDDSRPARVIGIDPAADRTYHYWHVFVPGALPARSTATGSTGRSILPAACGSTRPRFSWIPMGEAWSSRKGTSARPPSGRGITPRRP